MTTIKYISSLGPRCHTASFLKRNNLKTTSYPFDWIFSSPDMILHCLEDNFNMFLNKKYFTIKDSKSKNQQHSFYSENENEILFNHHNPLKTEDYNYFIRCIIRFKKLLLKPDLKIFILTFLNYPKIDKQFKNNIIQFAKKLGDYTKNYGILCIIQHTANELSHKYTIHNNIHFLEIFTKSSSNGINFYDNEDNIYLDDIIKKTYLFDLLEIDQVTNEEIKTELKEHENEDEDEDEDEDEYEGLEEVVEVEEEAKVEKEEEKEQVEVVEVVVEVVEVVEEEVEEEVEVVEEEVEEVVEVVEAKVEKEEEKEKVEEVEEEINKIVKGIVKELIEKIENKEKIEKAEKV